MILTEDEAICSMELVSIFVNVFCTLAGKLDKSNLFTKELSSDVVSLSFRNHLKNTERVLSLRYSF